MSQVVTNENMLELIQTGRVAEFVAPVTEPVKVEEAKAEPTVEKSVEEKPTEAVATEAAKPTDVDAELPEKVQKRINEKHRQMKEAEEWGKAQYLEKLAAEKRVGELEAKVSGLEKSNTPAPVKEPATAPKQEDFSTVAEYVDASVDWKLKQKEAEAAESVRKSEQIQLEQAHQKRILEASSRIADYESVVNKSEIELRMPLIQYIRESDMGPDLAYHLAKNPDVAERLNRLSPIKQLAEMGKLEMTIQKPAKADEPKSSKTPEQSKAPAPITPIDGKKEPVTKDPSEMSFAELRQHNEQQRRLKAAKR
jgi:hypothetical protein